MTKLTEKCREAIRQQYKMGLPVTQIAAPFGISPQYVYYVVGPKRKAASKPPPNKDNRPMSNLRQITDAAALRDATRLAMDALATHRTDVMALVQTINASRAIQAELHTQMQLMGHDELTVTQQMSWDAADDARDRARLALPGALGLTEADLQLLHGVI